MAITQNSIKRMLGYSSIAHLGYLLVAFIAVNDPKLAEEQPVSIWPVICLPASVRSVWSV